jgi:hypothetical protein
MAVSPYMSRLAGATISHWGRNAKGYNNGEEGITLRPLSQRVMQRLLPRVTSFVVCFGALTAAIPNCAMGAGSSGVRNILYVRIKADPHSVDPQQNSKGPHAATLTVRVRLSAHSQETNFFGIVPVTVTNFNPIKGSPEQEVWKDARCHHERGGYPKMTVITVDGIMIDGQKQLPISARFRWTGLGLPKDEVMASRGLVLGSDDVGPFVATRTETTESHLAVDLKMYTLACTLSVSAD